MRGGEKVLEVFCELYPEATVFTLLHIPGSVSPRIESMKIETSFIQKMPFVKKKYRSYLPLFPAAIERFDLRRFDLVLSSSHCVAKGAIPGTEANHVCYCHTPMRYVWAMYEEYFGKGKVGGVSRMLIPHFASYLRTWDAASCPRVDEFVANSHNVSKRIERYYGRGSDVIYPPVDTEGTWLSTEDEGYYLAVSAFAPYKKVEIAVEAMSRLGRKLVIVGTGQDEKKLKKAAGADTVFVGWADSESLRKYYAGCRALLFPGEEDFGIVPVEAQCYGKPVIAYGAGGALETVVAEGRGYESAGAGRAPTGVFFDEQTPEALAEAVLAFESMSFDHKAIREHALSFDRALFKKRISEKIGSSLLKG